MDVSVTLSGFSRLFGNDFARVLDAARAIDGAGATTLVLADHVVMGDRVDRYPFGTFPYGPEEPWPEPLTLLAAIAGVTTEVRLGTGIVITPLRPAPLLAKICATLDQVSGGRLTLGVGPGWQREEYAACGLDFANRWQIFDDGLRACAALWTQQPPVSFASQTTSFGPTWCLPQPVQNSAISAIPLVYGIPATPVNVTRIAELGAGWIPIHTTTPDGLREGVAAIRAGFENVGRDAASLRVRATGRVQSDATGKIDWSATLDASADLREIGVTEVAVGLGRHCSDTTSIEHFVTRAVACFAAL